MPVFKIYYLLHYLKVVKNTYYFEQTLYYNVLILNVNYYNLQANKMLIIIFIKL